MEPINRKLLKENGKPALKRNFWMIMLVVFVGGILGAQWTGLLDGGGGVNFNFNVNYSNNTFQNGLPDDTNVMEVFLESMETLINQKSSSDFDYTYNYALSESDNIKEFIEEFCSHFHISQEKLVQSVGFGIGIFLLIFLLIYVLVVCFQFLIGSFLYAPVGVGYRRYFMKNHKGEVKFAELFSSFSGGNYMRIVGTMFAANIRIFGWSLLFYFPGLVKRYQYYFVPYIMAENPEISKERAMEISRKMTDGHKWQMFVLDLSFIGWVLVFILEELVLALISCGILAIPGVLLIYPLVGYEQVTWAELYAERREYMLVTGGVFPEELKGF
jgi:uncharacterized membrane protein